MDDQLSPAEYEQLTEHLVARLAVYFGGRTSRLERNVKLPGFATTNEVDVIWEGTIGSSTHRLIFEAKRYKSRVTQGKLHAFTNVLRDIGRDIPTTGVFVAQNGFQSGARRVAAGYDVIVLEMRQPTTEDLQGRVTRIDVAIDVTLIDLDDLRFELDGAPVTFADGPVQLWDNPFSQTGTEDRVPVSVSLVAAQEAAGAAGQAHGTVLRHEFASASVITIDGHPLGQATAVEATVRVSNPRTELSVGPGPHGIAALVKDAVGGEVWVTSDRVYDLRGNTADGSGPNLDPPTATGS